MNAESIVGTKCRPVTASSRRRRAKYSGSLCPSGAAITTHAPSWSGQYSSHTWTSKEIAVL